MRVVRNTPDQLIVANRPWLLGCLLILFILAFFGVGILVATSEEGSLLFGVLFGGFGGGIGLAVFCGLVRRVQIVFNRTTGEITIRRQSVFGYSSDVHPLEQLSHVVVESTTTMRDRTPSTLYRPTLVLSADKNIQSEESLIPIVVAYSGGPGAEQLAEAINAWHTGSGSL